MKYTLKERQEQVNAAYDKFITENAGYNGKIECHFSGINGEIVTIQKHENI